MPEELPPLDWEGFETPRYTQVPDELFDRLLPYLTESELKVLLYIMRRTFGFKKDADAISVEQMTEGIVRKDGRRLDWGAGVSRKSVQRGIAGLLDKRLIVQTKTYDAAGRDMAPIYRLRWRGDRFDAPSAPGADNLSKVGASEVSPQDPDVTTHRESGSNALIENALRQLCKARGWSAPTRADYDVMSAAWQASGQDATTFAAALPLRTHGARSVAEAARQLGEG
jgi:hypothetical protein